MNIVPAFLDMPLRYGGGASPTLLTAPLSDGTLLRYLHERVHEATAVAPAVLATFPIHEPYRDRLASAGVPLGPILHVSRLGELLDAHEPADRLLLIDARWFPEGGFDLRGLDLRSSASPAPRYFTPLLRDAAGTREYLQLDPDGGVRKIQRYYDGVTRLRTLGVLCATMPVAAARPAAGEAFASLAALREIMASRRTLLQDVPIDGPMIDLTQEEGILSLNEQFLVRGVRVDPSLSLSQTAPGILVGEGVRVDPGARLVGPLVLHTGSRVERGGMLIGPMVVGPDSRIGEHAALAQCLVLPATTVRPGAVYRREVLGPQAALAPTARTRVPGRYRVGGGSSPNRASGARSIYPAVKRCIDATVALLALLMLAPLLAVLAVLVKLTSRGPVFFADEREGREGRVFRCFKFRTMRHNAHLMQRKLYAQNDVDGPQFKMKHDPRITPLGRFLRKSNLDELPQLWNVLVGDMSLIGPRPSPFRENQICVAWRNARLSVRPGITGLWQVCRHDRENGDFHQWIHFDTLYVRRLSFALDARIFLATLGTLGGRFSVPVSWIVPEAGLETGFDLPPYARPVHLE